MKLVQTWFPKPRWKQYAAQSGYVYHYLFDGFAAEELSGAAEYAFVVTSGPAIRIRIRVALDPRILDAWAAAHRPLTDVERYAIAKMTLLVALDESASPGELPSPLRPALEAVEKICGDLDF